MHIPSFSHEYAIEKRSAQHREAPTKPRPGRGLRVALLERMPMGQPSGGVARLPIAPETSVAMTEHGMSFRAVHSSRRMRELGGPG